MIEGSPGAAPLEPVRPRVRQHVGWVVTGVAALGISLSVAGAQRRGDRRAAGGVEGKPDLGGVWQSANTANWDIQDPPARPGPPQFGALFAAPAGQGVVVGDEIPYQPWAVAKKS